MTSEEHKPKYQLLADGTFVIENYNQAAPFASFLPGVAGLHGIPLWCFYVNRGQCVSSFGTRDKDHAILEFYPANKAYQNTSTLGFRTFIKVQKRGLAVSPLKIYPLAGQIGFSKEKPLVHEPFSHFNQCQQEMRITSYDLTIKERVPHIGLETSVKYFTLPNAPFAALVRAVTFKNISQEKIEVQCLDGLPAIVPYGMNHWLLKHMSRTAEAWIGMTNLEETGVPYFKLKVEVRDTPQVKPIEEGHFYCHWRFNEKKALLSPIVVDPLLIFGPVSDFSWPQNFFTSNPFSVPKKQIVDNKTPCAFSFFNMELKPEESSTFYTLIGHIRGERKLNSLLPRLTQPGVWEQKEIENREVVESIQNHMQTRSALPAFDHYCRQSYLDNVLRGGMPYPIATQKNPFVIHVYWRKHGDLERDYNHFEVLPTYYTQGNANYRDINQNRRMDPWFCPEVGDLNIVTFLNMLQLDGFNPLVLKSVRFYFRPSRAAEEDLHKHIAKKDLPELLKVLKKPLTPGELLMQLEEKAIESSSSVESLLSVVLTHSDRIQEMEPGEGYWIDHWHYNLDLLESYFNLFPEKWRELLIEKHSFTFYDSPLRVRPRHEKYVLDQGRVRQFHALFHDKEKEAFLKKHRDNPSKVRKRHGKGEVLHTNLFTKLVTLLVNKLASLDPFGVGLEMEADRPNWYDALNGLPGLFGSSVSETFELKRLIGFLETAIKKMDLPQDFAVSLPMEVKDFFEAIEKNLDAKDFTYWEKTTTAKEIFREKIRWGVHGKVKTLSLGRLVDFLYRARKKVQRGLEKAWSEKEGAPLSYFAYEAVQFQQLQQHNSEGKVCVRVKKFKAHALPLFLEGIVHALRTETHPAQARGLYQAVRKSDLYDRKLGMVKVNASLQNETVELGRTRVFSPGWLENASIFMHMEFKYLLEVLRAGLVEEFFDDLKKAAPFFMDPAVYGRSILENSTFIASSANPDPRMQGQGFVARLSGTNAEWVHLWVWLVVGKEPFQVNAQGKLEFSPQPILPGWLFKEKEKTFSFCFLGKIDFTYFNSHLKDTFGKRAAQPKKWQILEKNGRTTSFSGKSVAGSLAEKIRGGQVSRIRIELD